MVDLAQAVADEAGPGGFDGLTLAAVAARAGVAVPSLYKHVDGLVDLRRELAWRAATEFAEALAGSVAVRSPAEALRAAGRAVRAYALAYPARYAAVQAAPSLGDLPDARLSTASRRVVVVLTEALRGAVTAQSAAAGTDTEETGVHVVRVVRAAIHGFVDLELHGGFALPEDLERSFGLLLEVLVSGLGVAEEGA
ncbi:TetR-like C-terminal domain-containing protein [Actinotalea fermentans]|uniref:TetR-like C-terminal domain-containing protein n=1 Tax=Actinotalea fermentans TaxID=43671 RepID=UPI0021C1CBBA|nr:TetR-like C-terminal domain-containing protein [Actinotalea fermentans]